MKTLFTSEQIQTRIQQLADQINSDFADKHPIFLPVLNGSFRFASDLLHHITIPAEMDFIKLKSYQGTESGEIEEITGLDTSLHERDIIIVEDIVDTGQTLTHLLEKLAEHEPTSIKVCSLLSKSAKHDHQIDYLGFELDDEFVVGYGLDLDGKHREMNGICLI
jgi:hypoxanthine phosphoribosyltransferase